MLKSKFRACEVLLQIRDTRSASKSLMLGHKTRAHFIVLHLRLVQSSKKEHGGRNAGGG